MPPSMPKHEAVTIRPEWAEFLDKLPGRPQIGAPSRVWTAEEDALLVAARDRGARWLDIAKVIGCAQDTARKRWRELTAK